MSRYKVRKASDIRQRWHETVNEVVCENTRILIKKSGVLIAGVVNRQDVQGLEECVPNLAKFRTTMDEIRLAFCDVPPEQFNRAVQSTVHETRAPL